jgi:hypothetical protein
MPILENPPAGFLNPGDLFAFVQNHTYRSSLVLPEHHLPESDGIFIRFYGNEISLDIPPIILPDFILA